MSVQLQYTYAIINVVTGECMANLTQSYEVNHESYILVPTLDDYVGKYYNREDGLWYLDSSMETVWADAPQW